MMLGRGVNTASFVAPRAMFLFLLTTSKSNVGRFRIVVSQTSLT